MQDTVDQLRYNHYRTTTYRGECISNREITHVDQMTNCSTWRTIETEIAYCLCNADLDGELCIDWTCEKKDTGMFSILFYHPMSYDPYVDGIESTRPRAPRRGTALSTTGAAARVG